MSRKEWLITGIRQQRDRLDQAVRFFEQRGCLRSDDFGYCDLFLREIEKSIKMLRKEAVQEMLRENRLTLHLEN